MWFWYALASSLIAAVSVIYNKHALRSVSPKLLAWALFAFPIPFLFVMLFFYPATRLGPMFWVGVSGSALFFVVAKLWQLEALQTGMLSKLMPLSALVVFFSYLLGLFFLKEHISLVGIWGMLLIIAGTYVLNIRLAKEGIFQPWIILLKEKETVLYILALFFGALTAIFDKTGLINTHPTNPVLTLLIENILTVVPFSWYITKRENAWLGQLKRYFWKLVIGGLLYSISVIFIFYGFTSGPIALSVSIRQSQIILVMIFGYLLYKDKPPLHTWLATFVMLIGVVILKQA